MAPYTPEGAPLQKNTGANTVTVVNAKFLYVKYNALFQSAHPLSCLIISFDITKYNLKIFYKCVVFSFGNDIIISKKIDLSARRP